MTNIVGHIYGDLKQRLHYFNPITRIRSRHDVVHVRKTVLLIGLKRSGLHAVANWLIGMCPGAVLLNNSPMKRFGTSSPMSRTLRRSPLPIYVHRRYPVIGLDAKGEECPGCLQDGQPLVVVLFQSQELDHLSLGPLLQGIESDHTSTALLLRDPFNWSASMKAKSREPGDDSRWPQQWREYALEFAGASHLLPDAVRLNYNRWLTDKTYRTDIAREFGLSGHDKHLGVVTRHAGGSSFDGTDFDGRAMKMHLTSRWQCFREEKSYIRAFEANPDLVEMGIELFELPEDLRTFAGERTATAGSARRPACPPLPPTTFEEEV